MVVKKRLSTAKFARLSRVFFGEVSQASAWRTITAILVLS